MKYIVLILFFFIFFINKVKAESYVHADTQEVVSTTNIICSNGFSQWHWLKDSNNNKYKMEGKWGEFKYVNYKNSRYDIISNFYFVPMNDDKLKEFRNNCIAQFGEGFNYIHPANSLLDDWYLFRDRNGNFYEGEVTIKIRKCNLNMSLCSTKERLLVYKKILSFTDFIKTLKD